MDPIYKQLQNRMLKNMFMGLKTMKSMVVGKGIQKQMQHINLYGLT